MITDYNTEKYKTIIQKILDNGYQFVFYPSDVSSKISDDKQILLRHDIDFSLLAAKHIAEIDNCLGIKSTFFIYLNSPFYNILFEKDKECIDFIISLGHEVALHYDWRVDIEIEYEIELLSKLFPDIRTNLISIHKPPKKEELNKIIENLNLKNINTTYDNAYFENMKYISDSKCEFNIDELYGIIESNKSFQLLLHPVWWYFEGNCPENKLKNLCNAKLNEKKDTIREDITIPNLKL